MMPVMDGWRVLDRLSRHPRPPRVVVVSAKTSGEDVARALRAGALDYLTKPFHPTELDRVVEEILALEPRQFDAHRQARLARAGAVQ
jgi:DNA-binding response OmpR family regulator